MSEYSTKGKNVVADFYDCQNDISLDDMMIMREVTKIAISKSNATLIQMNSHKFEPQGLTITAIISESSLDLHTYPEHKFFSVSFYTCGDDADPLLGIQYLDKYFEPTRKNIAVITRGDNEMKIEKVTL